MATREIIVLDAVQDPTGVNLTVTAAFWLVAPASRVKPAPTFSSAVPVVAQVSWGVSSAELSQLQAGTLVEKLDSVVFAVSGLTTAAIEAGMQARYSALQTALNSLVFSTIHFVGAFWDGTTWTAGP